jgi:hypothetical protein
MQKEIAEARKTFDNSEGKSLSKSYVEKSEKDKEKKEEREKKEKHKHKEKETRGRKKIKRDSVAT